MKTRDSRFELLRIGAIFLIIIYHYALYGPWQTQTTAQLTDFGLFTYLPLGHVGVKLFVLITGYFSATKQFNLKTTGHKIKTIWLQVFFYSVTIELLFSAIRGVSPLRLLTAIFPIILNEYWFVTAYLFLMALIPFINLLIKQLDKRAFIALILICTLLSDVLPRLGNTTGGGDITSLMILITAYLIGAFIKIYDFQLSRRQNLLLIGGSLLLIYLSFVGFSLLGLSSERSHHLIYGIFPLLCASGLFLLVKASRPYTNKTVNLIASTTFAAYLISEHPAIRPYLWRRLLDFGQYQQQPLLMLSIGLACGVAIILLAAMIDLLRQHISNQLSAHKKRHTIEKAV